MRARRDGLAEFGKEQVIAAVSSRVITKATPVSRAGQTAPMIQADWYPTSRNPRGVSPRCHQT